MNGGTRKSGNAVPAGDTPCREVGPQVKKVIAAP